MFSNVFAIVWIGGWDEINVQFVPFHRIAQGCKALLNKIRSVHIVELRVRKNSGTIESIVPSAF